MTQPSASLWHGLDFLRWFFWILDWFIHFLERCVRVCESSQSVINEWVIHDPHFVRCVCVGTYSIRYVRTRRSSSAAPPPRTNERSNWKLDAKRCSLRDSEIERVTQTRNKEYNSLAVYNSGAQNSQKKERRVSIHHPSSITSRVATKASVQEKVFRVKSESKIKVRSYYRMQQYRLHAGQLRYHVSEVKRSQLYVGPRLDAPLNKITS